MALFAPLFKAEAEGGITPVGDVPTYLSNELGITLREKQNVSLAEAIQKPQDFITARDARIKKIIRDNVQPAYVRAVQELAPLGLPEETFKALALKRAQNEWVASMEVDSLLHVGMDRALGAQEAKRDTIDNRYAHEANSNNVQERMFKEERRAIKAKAIAKYKAKKKAKRARKA